jgi:hypothetical protein
MVDALLIHAEIRRTDRPWRLRVIATVEDPRTVHHIPAAQRLAATARAGPSSGAVAMAT